MDWWNKEVEFLFKFMMGKLNLLTQWVELLDKVCVANKDYINTKFESVEVTLEWKIIRMEIDLLTSNSKLISKSMFIEVQEIIFKFLMFLLLNHREIWALEINVWEREKGKTVLARKSRFQILVNFFFN